MNTRFRQSGFSAVEIVLVVAVVALVGVLGYVFYTNQMNKDDTSQTTSESAVAEDVDSAPIIDSVEDLDAAEAVLDQNDPEQANSDDSSQLDSELSNF